MSRKLTNNIFMLLITSCLTGCLSPTSAETPIQYVPFSVIVSGQYPISGADKNRKMEVFKDQPSFDAELALYVELIQPHIVDFSAKRVVLITLGQRNTGGYSVAMTGVQEFSDYIRASITITKPGSNCAVPQSITSPFQFIEVQGTKEMIFTEQLVVSNCS
jgi:hypothetical protein